MFNKIMTGALVILGLSLGNASASETINFFVGHGNGGLSSAFQTKVATGLKDKGWNINFKIIGNCGKVKADLDSSNEPMIAGWGADWNADSKNVCYNPPSADAFVDVFVISPRLLCGPLGDANFKLEKGKKYVVGVNEGQNHQVLLNDLGAKLGVTFKVVEYRNSGFIKRAMQAKEIDAWYTTKGLVEHQSGQQKCLYGTLTTPLDGITPLNTVLNTDNVYSSFVGYLITNNKFSADTRKKLVADINDIIKSAEYRSALKSTGSYVTDDNSEAQVDYVKATAKAFAK